jgi:hypothetical protein
MEIPSGIAVSHEDAKKEIANSFPRSLLQILADPRLRQSPFVLARWLQNALYAPDTWRIRSLGLRRARFRASPHRLISVPTGFPPLLFFLTPYPFGAP